MDYPAGKYCIVRTYASGVWCAVLEKYDPQSRHASLTDARRLWGWSGAFTLSTVALRGVAEAQMPAPLNLVIVAQVEEIIPVAPQIEQHLRLIPEYRP